MLPFSNDDDRYFLFCICPLWLLWQIFMGRLFYLLIMVMVVCVLHLSLNLYGSFMLPFDCDDGRYFLLCICPMWTFYDKSLWIIYVAFWLWWCDDSLCSASVLYELFITNLYGSFMLPFDYDDGRYFLLCICPSWLLWQILMGHLCFLLIVMMVDIFCSASVSCGHLMTNLYGSFMLPFDYDDGRHFMFSIYPSWFFYVNQS